MHDQNEPGAPRKGSRKPSVTPSRATQAWAQMLRFLEAGDWTPAEPIHLVALYLWCHHEVYGVEAREVSGTEYATAIHGAKTFLTREFGGDINACVAFIRWAWDRELGREKWRRENNKGGSRIGWRLQFSASMVTDYRLDQARRKSSTRVER